MSKKKIELVKNKIQELKDTNDTYLGFRGYKIKIGNEGAKALAAELKDINITSLDLSHSKMWAEGAKALAVSLKSSNVTELDLSYNKIGKVGVKVLAEALKYTKIAELNLEHNEIGSEGAKTLANGLKGSNVTKLNLGNNSIDSEGVQILAAVLKDTNITELNLSNNRIDSEGEQILAAVLKDTNVTELDLYDRNFLHIPRPIDSDDGSISDDDDIDIDDEREKAVDEINRICNTNKSKIQQLFQAQTLPTELQVEGFYKQLYHSGSLITALKKSAINVEDIHRQISAQFSQCGDIWELDLGIIKKSLLGDFIVADITDESTKGEERKTKKYYDEALKLNPNDAEAYYGQGMIFVDLENNDEASTAFLKAADIFYKKHDYKRCIDACNKIIIKQKNAHAYNLQGNSLSALGDRHEAIKCYDEAIGLNPKDAVLYYNKGNARSALSEHAEAIECYNQAIYLDPQDVDFYYNKGNALSALGEHAEARKCYNKAIHFDLQNVKADNLQGNALEALVHNEDAIKAYDEGIVLVKLKPGNILFRENQYEKAIDAYDKVIKINPENAVAYYSKGRALAALGRKEEAIKACEEAIRLDPQNAAAYNHNGTAHFVLGTVLSALGRQEEAITAYNKSLQINAKDALAHVSKGIALAAVGDKKGAIDAYNKAIKINSQYCAAHHNKGAALSALGQNKEAIDAYDKAIEINSKYAYAYYGKGLALSALGLYEEAILEYDKATAIDPKFTLLYHSNDVTPAAVERREGAILEYDKSLEVNTRYTAAYQGKHDEARKCYNETISLDSHYAEAYYGQGMIFADLGEHAKASAAFFKAATIFDKTQTYDRCIDACDRYKRCIDACDRDEKCIDAFGREEAIAINRHDTYVYTLQGNSLSALDKKDMAITYYNKALDINPNNAVIHYNKGNAFNALGRYKDALKAYDKAINLDSEYVDAWNGKGNAFNALGQYRQALEALNAAIELDLEDAAAWNNKGAALNNLGRHKEALKACEEAIRLDPKKDVFYKSKRDTYALIIKKNLNNAEAYYGQGMTFVALKDNQAAMDAFFKAAAIFYENQNYQGAIDACSKSIEANSNDANLYNLNGKALSALNRNEEAIEAYNKAIAINPKEAAFYCNKGDTLFALKCIEDAMKEYDKALEIDPAFAMAYSGKGCVLSAFGNANEALQQHDKAIKLEDESSILYYNKGQTLQGINHTLDALECFNKAYKLSGLTGGSKAMMTKIISDFAPGDKAVVEWLICYVPSSETPLLSANSARNGQVVQWLIKKGADVNAYIDYIYHSGRDLFNKHQYQEATNVFEFAIEQLGDDNRTSKIQNELGRAYYELNKYNEAIQAYSKAIDINKNNSIYHNNLGIAYEASKKYDSAINSYKKAIKLSPQNHGYYKNYAEALSLLPFSRTNEVLAFTAYKKASKCPGAGKIYDKKLENLQDLIKKSKIETLDLSNKDIDKKDLEYVLDLLNDNKYLCKLDLSENPRLNEELTVKVAKKIGSTQITKVLLDSAEDKEIFNRYVNANQNTMKETHDKNKSELKSSIENLSRPQNIANNMIHSMIVKTPKMYDAILKGKINIHEIFIFIKEEYGENLEKLDENKIKELNGKVGVKYIEKIIYEFTSKSQASNSQVSDTELLIDIIQDDIYGIGEEDVQDIVLSSIHDIQTLFNVCELLSINAKGTQKFIDKFKPEEKVKALHQARKSFNTDLEIMLLGSIRDDWTNAITDEEYKKDKSQQKYTKPEYEKPEDYECVGDFLEDLDRDNYDNEQMLTTYKARNAAYHKAVEKFMSSDKLITDRINTKIKNIETDIDTLKKDNNPRHDAEPSTADDVLFTNSHKIHKFTMSEEGSESSIAEWVNNLRSKLKILDLKIPNNNNNIVKVERLDETYAPIYTAIDAKLETVEQKLLDQFTKALGKFANVNKNGIKQLNNKEKAWELKINDDARLICNVIHEGPDGAQILVFDEYVPTHSRIKRSDYKTITRISYDSSDEDSDEDAPSSSQSVSTPQKRFGKLHESEEVTTSIKNTSTSDAAGYLPTLKPSGSSKATRVFSHTNSKEQEEVVTRLQHKIQQDASSDSSVVKRHHNTLTKDVRDSFTNSEHLVDILEPAHQKFAKSDYLVGSAELVTLATHVTNTISDNLLNFVPVDGNAINQDHGSFLAFLNERKATYIRVAAVNISANGQPSGPEEGNHWVMYIELHDTSNNNVNIAVINSAGVIYSNGVKKIYDLALNHYLALGKKVCNIVEGLSCLDLQTDQKSSCGIWILDILSCISKKIQLSMQQLEDADAIDVIKQSIIDWADRQQQDTDAACKYIQSQREYYAHLLTGIQRSTDNPAIPLETKLDHHETVVISDDVTFSGDSAGLYNESSL